MTLLKTSPNRQTCILYVDRSTISYYSRANSKPDVLELGPDVVKNMEVFSPDRFVSALAFWMDNNKIPPGDCIVVLSSNVYFEYAVQSLSGAAAEDQEIDMFLGTVPFTQSIHKVVEDGASKRAIVVSKDYYELLLEFLEKRYFRVLALFPSSLMKIKSPEEIKADHIIKNMEEYKKYNFLGDFERKPVKQSFIAKNSPRNTKNLKLMVAAFSLLLGILGIMMYLNFVKK